MACNPHHISSNDHQPVSNTLEDYLVTSQHRDTTFIHINHSVHCSTPLSHSHTIILISTQTTADSRQTSTVISLTEHVVSFGQAVVPFQQFAVQRQRKVDVDNGEVVDSKTTQDANQSIHVTRLK